MKSNPLFLLTILVAITCLGGVTPALAQCTQKLPDTRGKSLGDVISRPQDNDPKPETQFSHILAVVDAMEQFKISLNTDLESGFSRTNDLVPFTIEENVYGKALVPVFPVNRPRELREYRCLVIPKTTRIYGVVDRARSSYPFWIGGKAKLYIAVTEFKLEDGTRIYINFRESDYYNGRSKPTTKPCEQDPSKNCITGRRKKVAFPTPAIAAATGVGLLFAEKDDTTRTIAGLTFLDALSTATGVDSLVNPPNATLKDKMIFNVSTLVPVKIWAPLTAPPAKKAE